MDMLMGVGLNVGTGNTLTGKNLVSTVSTGTAPLTVSSQTKVTNLNVDQVDGCGVNDGGSTSSDLWTAAKVISYISANTSPKQVTTVRVRATGNVDLSLNLNGATIDGTVVSTGDEVFLDSQTIGSEDGVYTIGNGAGQTVRADQWGTSESVSGRSVTVTEGTVNGDKMFLVTNNSGSDILGTDNITVINTSSGEINTASNVGAGAAVFQEKDGVNLKFRTLSSADTDVFTISASGDIVTFTIVEGGIDLANLGGDLNLATQVTGTLARANGGAQRYSATITGDGAMTSFTVTHSFSLATKEDVIVSIIDLDSGNVYSTSWSPVNGNSISVSFTDPPANAKQYRVVCLA